MTRKFYILIAVLAAVTLTTTAVASKKKGDRDQRIEKSANVAETVTVSLCVTAGDLTVHGWDRKEVRARARNASQIELRRDEPDASGVATRITVLLSGSGTGYRSGGVDCQVFGDVELDVPRGATVRLSSGNGMVKVSKVASAFVDTQSGDIEVSEVIQAVEANTLNGSLKVTNCTGRARLHTIGGNIEATNMRPLNNENFRASSVSGEITLERIGHQNVAANTATGSVNLIGPLVKGGHYSMGTISGDVTLRLPADSSFQLNAKVSPQGDIVSDFPLKLMNPPEPPNPTPPAPKKSISVVESGTRKISGTYGSGDATISLASFSGMLALHKN